MMNYECLLYGFRSLLIGLPIATLFIAFYALIANISQMSDLIVPWGAYLISIVAVFIVVFSTMLYSMRKIGRMNTVDILKDENI